MFIEMNGLSVLGKLSTTTFILADFREQCWQLFNFGAPFQAFSSELNNLN